MNMLQKLEMYELKHNQIPLFEDLKFDPEYFKCDV